MEIPEARWIVWGSILVVLILVAFYCAKKFRDMATGAGYGSTDLLPDADKLRLEGKLDESEYKKIKSTIAEQQKQFVNKENNEND